VQIGKRHRNLTEYGEDLGLRELFAVRRELVVSIAAIGIFHDNEEVPGVLEALDVSDDVRVVEFREELGFGNGGFRQRTRLLDLLLNVKPARLATPHKIGGAKAALPEVLHELVLAPRHEVFVRSKRTAELPEGQFRCLIPGRTE
jgi:hypothetical protein